MSSDSDATGRSIDPSESAIGRAIERAADRLSRASADSAIIRTGRRTADRASEIAVDSTLADFGRFLAEATRNSWLFRWLTAEPDPEVIVIDLRETWTVGPVLVLLDRILGRLGDAAADSWFASAAESAHAEFRAAPLRVLGLLALAVGLASAVGVFVSAVVADGSIVGIRSVLALAVAAAGTIALRDDRTWSELRETRPVELLVAALEPPEPPESPDPSESPDPPEEDATRSASETDEDVDPDSTR
jgi:hypothetical protein